MEKEQWLLNNVLAKIVHEKQIDILILPKFLFSFSPKIVALQVENRCCPHYHRVLDFPRNKFQCCKLKTFVAKSRTRVYFAQHIAVTSNTEICCVAS